MIYCDIFGYLLAYRSFILGPKDLLHSEIPFWKDVERCEIRTFDFKSMIVVTAYLKQIVFDLTKLS